MGKRVTAAIFYACAGLAAGCGKHTGGDGDGGFTYGSIDVEPPFANLTIPLDGTATQAYQVFGVTGTDRTDITADCALAIDPMFGTIAGPVVTVQSRGGKTPVTATCGGETGSAELSVNLTGSLVVGANTPANAADIFGAATLGTAGAQSPVIEYPIDQAVTPLNLPPIEVQWVTSGDDLFHIAITSTFATIDVYTSDPQATIDTVHWADIANTAAGDRLQFVVEGLVQATPTTKYASAPATIGVSHDTIDQTALYWWESSNGNIVSQTFGATNAPTLVEGNCTACHSLSRAGTRLGYSRCVAGVCGPEYVGFLKYNPMTSAFDEVINADNKAIDGTFTTFSPLGNPFPDDSQSVAIVTHMSGLLDLYDPDTGVEIPSNIATVSNHGPGSPNRSALMPDWSADGNTVVFASTPHPNQAVDLNDSTIATMSYSYSGGTHTFGEPNFIVSNPITLAGGVYNSFFFPTFSPDGQFIVFNAARTTWRDLTAGQGKTPGQRMMLTNPTGTWAIDLTNLNGGTGDSNITWAHWAPGQTSDYYWIVFSSERPYGHEVTQSNTNPTCVQNGTLECKQIWISAISKATLMGGGTPNDPSFQPMWLPGQDTQADNISPYWTLPAQIQ